MANHAVADVSILMVEDDGLLREFIADQLRSEGYAVAEAETGEQAFAMIQDGQAFDMLLTDIRTPGALDGWTLAEAVRARRPDLPVVYASSEPREPARQVSDSVFVPKPYRAERVIEAVRRLM